VFVGSQGPEFSKKNIAMHEKTTNRENDFPRIHIGEEEGAFSPGERELQGLKKFFSSMKEIETLP